VLQQHGMTFSTNRCSRLTNDFFVAGVPHNTGVITPLLHKHLQPLLGWVCFAPHLACEAHDGLRLQQWLQLEQ
jgi:hypothetical protein